MSKYDPKAPRNRKPSGPEPMARWLASNPIRQARIAAKLTLAHVAAMARTSERTIRKLEGGACRRSEMLAKVGKILGDADLPDAWLRWQRRRPAMGSIVDRG